MAQQRDRMAEMQMVKRAGKEGRVPRRSMGYWTEFNKWYRDFWEGEGARPTVLEIKAWFDRSADEVWGHTKPTWEEARVHSKCLRSLDQVRNYFRQYRATRRGESLDGHTAATAVTGSKRSDMMMYSSGGGSFSQGTRALSQSDLRLEGDEDEDAYEAYARAPKARRPSVESGEVTVGGSFVSLGNTDLTASNHSSPVTTTTTSKLSGRTTATMAHDSGVGYPQSRSATPPQGRGGAAGPGPMHMLGAYQHPSCPSRLSQSSSMGASAPSLSGISHHHQQLQQQQPTSSGAGGYQQMPAPAGSAGSGGSQAAARSSSLTLVFGAGPGQPPLLNPTGSNPLPENTSAPAPAWGPATTNQRVRINVARQLPPRPTPSSAASGPGPQSHHLAAPAQGGAPYHGPPTSHRHRHLAQQPGLHSMGHQGEQAWDGPPHPRAMPPPYLSSYASAPPPYGYDHIQHPQHAYPYGAPPPGPHPSYGPSGPPHYDGPYYHHAPSQQQGHDGARPPRMYSPFMEPPPAGPYYPPGPGPASYPRAPFSSSDEFGTQSYPAPELGGQAYAAKATAADGPDDSRYPAMPPPMHWNPAPPPSANEVQGGNGEDDGDFGCFMEALLSNQPEPWGPLAAGAEGRERSPPPSTQLKQQQQMAATPSAGGACSEAPAGTPFLSTAFISTPQTAGRLASATARQHAALAVKAEPGSLGGLAAAPVRTRRPSACSGGEGAYAPQQQQQQHPRASITGDLQACVAVLERVAVDETAPMRTPRGSLARSSAPSLLWPASMRQGSSGSGSAPCSSQHLGDGGHEAMPAHQPWHRHQQHHHADNVCDVMVEVRLPEQSSFGLKAPMAMDPPQGPSMAGLRKQLSLGAGGSMPDLQMGMGGGSGYSLDDGPLFFATPRANLQ